MTRGTSGPMTDPQDQVALAFRRARDAQEQGAGVVVPSVRTVHRAATRVRRRRQAATAGAVAAAVVVGVGLISLLRPAGTTGTPATPASVTAPSKRTVVPLPSAAGRSADGLLVPSDLGTGWTADPAQTTDATVDLDACLGVASGVQVTGAPTTVRSQLFRGTTPEGSEWILSERFGTIRAQDVAGVKKQLRTLATCPDRTEQGVLAASADVVVTGSLTDVGSVGYAKGYVLAGRTLIALDTLPGGAIGGPGLPEQTSWMLAALDAAAVRATGRPVTLPEPNAYARQAASKYALLPPDKVVHVGSPEPVDPARDLTGGTAGTPVPDSTEPRGTPTTGTPTANDPVPPGFLTLGDLGPTGAWSVGAGDIDRHESARTSTELPSCPSAPTLTVSGKGVSQTYRGWLEGTGPNSDHSNEWIVNETMITLDQATAATVRARLTALAECPRVTTSFGAMEMVAPEPWRVVVVHPRADGGVGVCQGWLLVGSRLIQMDGLPGGAAGNRAMPGGGAWFSDVLAAAEQRARA